MSEIKYNLMNNELKHFNNNNNDDIVFVTAFFNINRSNWNISKRDINYYLDSLKILLITEKNIIVFIDDRYINLDFIQNYMYNIKVLNNKSKIIPINYEWLIKNSESWKKNEICKKIMNSNEYIQKVCHRIKAGNPENIYPEYNTINHCKIDLIKYAIDNNMIEINDLICWCDSGYHKSILHGNSFEYPYSSLDTNKFNHNKLNFCLRNKITQNDENIDYTLIYAPEVFTGSFFAGKIILMNKLYTLYHACLDEMYIMNIADDDQHIYLRCFLKEPDLFELFLSPYKWPKALCYFQKTFNHRFEFINHYISKINYGKFVEIGVCSGSLSENILNNNKNALLYCVDPYINYDDYDDACKFEVGDSLYNSTMNKLNTFFPNRTKFIREFSINASSQIENNLDFVYIDGNHKCKYVLEDLNIWYDKLKPGGFIICDDAVDTNDSLRDENGDIFITWNQISFGKYGVIEACKKFTNQNNIPFFKWDNQILIYKPLYVDKMNEDKIQKTVDFLTDKLTSRDIEITIHSYDKIKNCFELFYYSSEQDIAQIVYNNISTK